MALAREPALRRELGVLQARQRGATGHPRIAHRVLRDAAGRLAGEPSRAAELLLEAADSAVRAADSRAALGSAWQAYRLTRLCGGDLAEAAAVHLAQVLALRGERAQAGELLLAQTAGEAAGTLVGRAEVLGWLEEYEAACVLLDRVLGEQPGAERGAYAVRRAAALGCRAWIRLWTGDWHGARSDAMEAVECAERRMETASLAQGLVALGRLEAAQGRVTECGAVLARAAGVARAHGLELVMGQVAVAEGLLALGAGKYEEAVAGYERAGALARSAGIEDPSVTPWAANLIEAYVRSGRIGEAVREHARFDAEMRRSGPSWALAVSARCRALLLEADGHGTPGAVEAAFHEALEWHARGAVVFERARTVFCHGQWLRRTGRTPEARDALEEALSAFGALGAVPWEEAVRSELRAAGGRAARTAAGSSPSRRAVSPRWWRAAPPTRRRRRRFSSARRRWSFISAMCTGSWGCGRAVSWRGRRTLLGRVRLGHFAFVEQQSFLCAGIELLQSHVNAAAEHRLDGAVQHDHQVLFSLPPSCSSTVLDSSLFLERRASRACPVSRARTGSTKFPPSWNRRAERDQVRTVMTRCPSCLPQLSASIFASRSLGGPPQNEVAVRVVDLVPSLVCPVAVLDLQLERDLLVRFP